MTSRNIFIVLLVFGAAYFMAACDPGDPTTVPGVCIYDASAQAPDPCNGLGEYVTCREQHVGEATDCADGTINPPASCPDGVAVAVPGLDCITAGSYPGQPQLVYTGKCTHDSGVDFYAFGDCSEGGGVPPVFTNKYVCENLQMGTFECMM